MATLSESRTTIVYDEPATKPPPLLAVGPLAWIRKNLFSSWLDVLLTILSGLFIVTVVSSFVTWAVGLANWFIITYNLRLFLVGRYPEDSEWRLQVTALLIAFVVGFSLAAWMRLSRFIVSVLIVLLALALILPPVINTLIPLPPMYLTAGNISIESGSEKIQPQDAVAFTARAGETIRLQYAAAFAASDEQLARLSSFADEGANTLLNAASNRLTRAGRIAEIQAQLAGDLLTQSQRDRLQAELDRLEVLPPVTESYMLNQSVANIRVVRGTTQAVIAETQLAPDAPPFVVTLPEDGWYILEKMLPEGNESVALLQADGIYPFLERNIVRGAEGDQNTRTAANASIYIRMSDNFTTSEARPSVDGKPVPMAVIIDKQYRGERSLADFLRLNISPLLTLVNIPLLLIVVMGFIGYVASRGVDRFLSTPEKRASPRWATWLLVATPVVLFALIYGVGTSFLPFTDPRRWGGLLLSLLLTVVGIIASFPIGVLLALGRRSSLPAVRVVSTVYIELVRGVPLISVLFMASLLVPLINPALASVDNVFRAMVGITLFSAAYLAENVRGGLQSVPHGQEEAAKAIGLNSAQIILYITLPQALRAVIPALVGQFISLFKDTSLVAIIGLLDLTGIADTVITQTEFIGLRRETLLFITVLYFVFSYAISAVSRRIEASGAGRVAIKQL